MTNEGIINKKVFERELLLEIFEYIEIGLDSSIKIDVDDYFVELDKKAVVGSFTLRIYYQNYRIFIIEIENFADVVRKGIHLFVVDEKNWQVFERINWLIDKKILLGLFYRTLKKYQDEHFF